MLVTEEKERIRISRELHDGVGQQIAALKLNLGLLGDQLQLEDLKQEKMLNLIALADDVSKEVRTISHNLMPNALLVLVWRRLRVNFCNSWPMSELKLILKWLAQRKDLAIPKNSHFLGPYKNV